MNTPVIPVSMSLQEVLAQHPRIAVLEYTDTITEGLEFRVAYKWFMAQPLLEKTTVADKLRPVAEKATNQRIGRRAFLAAAMASGQTVLYNHKGEAVLGGQG